MLNLRLQGPKNIRRAVKTILDSAIQVGVRIQINQQHMMSLVTKALLNKRSDM